MWSLTVCIGLDWIFCAPHCGSGDISDKIKKLRRRRLSFGTAAASTDHVVYDLSVEISALAYSRYHSESGLSLGRRLGAVPFTRSTPHARRGIKTSDKSDEHFLHVYASGLYSKPRSVRD